MKVEQAIEKGIDLEELKQEQKKLAKLISLKDQFDIKSAQKFAGIFTETINRDILAVVVVLDENFEVIDRKYSIQKARFPYIPGFRAYRELNVIIDAFSKLETEPDVVFILGHGISHESGLGIASHLGISLQKPVIGIAKNLIYGEEKENKVYIDYKVVAEKLKTKEGAREIYVSPGNLISLKTALELTKKFVRDNHKLPETIIEARKFAKDIREEVVID